MNDKLLGFSELQGEEAILQSGLKCARSRGENRAKLIIVASDTAQRTEKELKFKTNGKDIEVVRISADKYSLSRAIGTSAGAVALFATKALQKGQAN